MRRLIAGLTGTLVIGAVAAVVLAPTQASLAGAPTVSSTLSPPSGQTAINEGDKVYFGGQVTPGSMKVSAFIHFKRADGRAFRQPLRVTSSVLIDSAGKISGDRGVNLTPDPEMPNNTENADGGHVYLELTMRDPDDQKETTARSNNVEIDLAKPVIKKTRLIGPNTVVIVFSEEVELPTQEDRATDWGVEVARSGDEVLYAAPTHALKTSPTEVTLTTAHAHDQDATPHVVYQAGLGADATRETYQDSSTKNPYGGNLYFLAQDLIPPPVPTIDSVAGRARTTLQANDPTPEIKLSAIRSGHWAEIYREANGQPGLQRPGDAFIGEDQADSSGAQVTTNDLGSDGTYELYAVARDNAVCDPSNKQQPAPCHNRSAGTAPIVYTLDRIAPAPLFAAATRVGEVTVGFTEAVTGSNSTANWKVDGQTPVAVSGAGDRRTILATNAVPGATLTYTPGDYIDEAGNPLPGFSAVLFDQLPPLVKVTDPANDQFVQESTYTIKGTASKANQVQIFRDADGNGEPEGDPVATAAVSGDSWSVSVPLNVDASNRFVARGLRTDNNPPIQGPIVPIDSALVQDSRAPTLTLAPFSPAYRGEFQVDIAWTADDANLGGGPMTIEFSPDGGATWQLIEAFYPDTSPYEEWATPKITTKDARIRVTATDRAGRSTARESALFEIDSIPPSFTALIEDATKVAVAFSEPVSGLMSPPEWEINDEMVSRVDPTGPVQGVTQATLTTGLTADDIDPNAANSVKYSPLTAETDLEDHVGNPILVDSVGSGGPNGNNGGGDEVTVVAEKGNLCTILGTDGADTLVGTDGADIICPLGGTDTVEALGGDDIIVAGPGSKTIDGGAGHDEINGGDGFDTLRGGPGDDVILGYGGDDQIFGNDGNDVLHGDEGSDTISGGNGIDIVEGEGGDDILRGDADIDHLGGSDGNDVLEGGDGNDRLAGHGGDDQLNGDDGNDFLEGADGVDILKGGSGNDQLSGSAGRDHLFGDSGNDKLEGGDDNDRVDGGSGNDVVNGGNGADFIIGGTGNDKGNGGTGKDRLQGESGKDVLTGGDDNDRLEGGSGNDELKGGDDNDSLYGGTGRDVMLGEDGRDRLYGDEHGDRLFGGSQRDRLDGGTSRDYCDGGPGGDARLGCEGGPQS